MKMNVRDINRRCLKRCLDEELYGLVSKGDEQAYTELYRRFRVPLLRYAAKSVSVEDAEDIVHDLLTKLWYNRDTIIIHKQVSSYLYGALRNRIIDYQTAHRSLQQYEAAVKAFPAAHQVSEGPDHTIRTKSFLNSVEGVLNRYGARAFRIVTLRIEGYNHHEIAEKLDLSEKTIRNQQSAIMKYLRDKLRIRRRRTTEK